MQFVRQKLILKTNTYSSDAVRKTKNIPVMQFVRQKLIRKTKTYSSILVMNRKCHNAIMPRRASIRF